MAIKWQCYRFNYARFAQLRPSLRSASKPEDFSRLADQVETEAIVVALMEGGLAISEARQEFVLTCCCPGDPLPLNQEFARLISALLRDNFSFSGLEILNDTLAGGKRTEDWLLPSTRLSGFLNTREAKDLAESLSTLARSARTKKRRQGGVLATFTGFFHRLFDWEPSGHEQFEQFRALLEEAVGRKEGVVFVAM